MKRNRFRDGMGLRLSRQALRVLRERGVFAQSSVSLQHQQLANRHVLRGVESGGAAGDIARFAVFAQEDGRPIEYVHLVEAIGVNGACRCSGTVLVRLDMLRKGGRYEVLITRHALGKTENGHRLPFGDDGVASRSAQASGFVGKRQGASWCGVAAVIFVVRRGDCDTGTVQAGGLLNRQRGGPQRLFPLSLRLRTTQGPRCDN